MKTKMVFSEILGKNVDVPDDEKDSNQMAELVMRYKMAANQLKAYRDDTFKKGAKAKVDCPRFTGIGKVACQHDVQPDLLAVTLENGNTWWYPIENCQHI